MAEQPGAKDVHADKFLTNLSASIINDAYISRLFFPQVLVNFQSDLIPMYDKSPWHRQRAKKLTEREAPPVSGYTVGSDRYFCEEWGLGHFISYRRAANSDSPYDAYRDGTRWLVDGLELAHEWEFVNNFWKINVWDTDEVGTTDFVKWSDYATSVPIQDMRGWRRVIRRALSGQNPNVLGLGDLTFDVLADHPELLDRIKYGHSSSSPAMVTPNLVAQLLQLEKVLVGVSMYTASPEGTAEGSVAYTPFWDDDALMLYVNPRPSLFSKSAGYKFAWRTVWGTPRYMRRREDPESAKGDLLELFEFWDMKVVYPQAGVFGSDCVD